MEVTIDQALQRGVAAHKAGNLQEAEKLYRAILQTQPQHPDANHNLGVLAVGVGQVENSLSYFKAALASNAKIEQYWLSYIDALIKLERLSDARQVLDQGRLSGLQGDKLAQLDARLESLGGKLSSLEEQLKGLITLHQQGRYQDALERGVTLSNQYPEDPNIPNIIGAAYAGLKKYEEAITYYNQAIQLKPDYAQAFNNLGITQKELGRYEEAVGSYNKAIKIKSDFFEAHNNLGVALNELGKQSEAIESYKKAILIKPLSANGYYNLGNEHRQLSNHNGAIGSYKRALTINPYYAELYNNLGLAVRGSEDDKEIIPIFMTSVV